MLHMYLQVEPKTDVQLQTKLCNLQPLVTSLLSPYKPSAKVKNLMQHVYLHYRIAGQGLCKECDVCVFYVAKQVREWVCTFSGDI